jgi:succinate dehydrogenase / fumarate reductase iron-sulfur subunit
MATNGKREVVFVVRRFDPQKDARPRWEEHRLAATPGMTVLEALWLIKETAAPGLAWRASCRMGVCGSCGMMINGRPRLACNTQIAELEEPRVVLAPLPNFPVIRDLVPDLTSMFDAHAALSPFLIRDDRREMEAPTAEYPQSAEELEEYLQFTYCIKCGCCMSACPTRALEPVYSGPMPLAQAHRYNADRRDDGFAERRKALGGEAGPWGCHFAGECSRACPKGVDPAKAIQLMKRQLVLDYLRLLRRRKPAGPASRPEGLEPPPDAPKAPPPTVGKGR